MSKTIPNLSDQERLPLQNILLRTSLEEERIEKLKSFLTIANIRLREARNQLEVWKSEYNKTLKTYGADVNQVNIDADTGTVTIVNNVQMLPVENKDATG